MSKAKKAKDIDPKRRWMVIRTPKRECLTRLTPLLREDYVYGRYLTLEDAEEEAEVARNRPFLGKCFNFTVPPPGKHR